MEYWSVAKLSWWRWRGRWYWSTTLLVSPLWTASWILHPCLFQAYLILSRLEGVHIFRTTQLTTYSQCCKNLELTYKTSCVEDLAEVKDPQRQDAGDWKHCKEVILTPHILMIVPFYIFGGLIYLIYCYCEGEQCAVNIPANFFWNQTHIWQGHNCDMWQPCPDSEFEAEFEGSSQTKIWWELLEACPWTILGDLIQPHQ